MNTWINGVELSKSFYKLDMSHSLLSLNLIIREWNMFMEITKYLYWLFFLSLLRIPLSNSIPLLRHQIQTSLCLVWKFQLVLIWKLYCAINFYVKSWFNLKLLYYFFFELEPVNYIIRVGLIIDIRLKIIESRKILKSINKPTLNLRLSFK